jgi:hypothetical protein
MSSSFGSEAEAPGKGGSHLGQRVAELTMRVASTAGRLSRQPPTADATPLPSSVKTATPTLHPEGTDPHPGAGARLLPRGQPQPGAASPRREVRRADPTRLPSRCPPGRRDRSGRGRTPRTSGSLSDYSEKRLSVTFSDRARRSSDIACRSRITDRDSRVPPRRSPCRLLSPPHGVSLKPACRRRSTRESGRGRLPTKAHHTASCRWPTARRSPRRSLAPRLI